MADDDPTLTPLTAEQAEALLAEARRLTEEAQRLAELVEARRALREAERAAGCKRVPSGANDGRQPR